ncbi:CD40 ligand [Lepisosteus oculatus]|uniref:CD40 ligand n=1 Tax=Lepisosteus oculatus TaxID=7918 RepID=W5NDA5_LEPOC|nr:PREDICTED: CD40 ligand [Lepisosteus oculatus]
MINTYNTTLPPPLPPRQMARVSSGSPTRPVIWFLSAVILVHMVVSVIMFMYLFRKVEEFQTLVSNHDDLILLRRLHQCEAQTQDKSSLLDCAKVVSKFQSLLSKASTMQESLQAGLKGDRPTTAVAHLRVKKNPGSPTGNKITQWSEDHSLLKNVDFDSFRSMIRITTPGIYYIYSQVTFSKTQDKAPVVQNVMKEWKGQESTLLTASSSLSNSRDPSLYTIYQGGVFELKKDEYLYVKVTNLSLVNFNENSTMFGLFMV